MEYFKALYVTIFMVTFLSSAPWTAPLRLKPSNAEILIRHLLMPTRANATKEMLTVHKFIASNWDLKETPLRFGEAHTQICSSNMKKSDRLSIALIQLHNFIRPLYLAYSLEESKGSQHKSLARALWDTSSLLNYTVQSVKTEIRRNEYQMPTTQHLSKVQMNHYTRDYLQAMVEQNRLSITITEDVVEIYRNYVILYTLKDVILHDVLRCL